ncbi:FapA family protein [Peptostreptococcaceae bacterium AGR-M142]
MPFLAKQVEKEFDNYKITLNVTGDYMNAYIAINTKDRAITIEKDTIMNLLKENDIIYGIEEETIDLLIKNKTYNSSIKVAQGLKPIKGEDAKITLYFDKDNKAKPKMDEKGTIDFKELNLFSNIEEGQLLGEKEDAKEGVPGKNVIGEELEAQKGKDTPLKAGKNTELDEEGFKIYSTTSGRPEFNAGTINVSNVLTVKEHVDASTGNIRFNGDVIVNGDVKTGFLVEAEGSIEVKGVIEATSIRCKGDLIVKGGIQGSVKEEIYCQGNLICKYIENARVLCDGDITTDFVAHSYIVCGNRVKVVGRKGHIVGGELKVRYEIDSNMVGSPMGTKTYIEVGNDPKLKVKLNAYLDEKKTIEKNLKELSNQINASKELVQRNLLKGSKKELFIKSVDLYNQYKEKFVLVEKEIEAIREVLENSYEGLLKVHNVVHPGTKIVIGSHVKFVKDEIKFSKFLIQDGDIAIKSL